MKSFNKEKRDLLHEVNKSEKELLVQTELKKKLRSKVDEMRRKYVRHFACRSMNSNQTCLIRANENTDYDRTRQRLDELQVSIAEQRQILSMKENEQVNFRQLLDDERQTLFDAQAALKLQEETVRKRRGAIQQLKAAKQDRVTIYGRYTLAILKEIDRQASRFKQIPIGPVGKIRSSG